MQVLHNPRWKSLHFGVVALALTLVLPSLGCTSVEERQRQILALTSGFKLEPGDLLFQDLDCGELCDAIDKVTAGACGAHFAHVGMVVLDKHGIPEVVEAIGEAVQVTPLDLFLQRSHDSAGRPKVVVGRLHLPKAERAQASINALALVGTPYDDAFLPDNSRLYCSELVVQSLDFIRGVGVDVPMQPMTFVDPDTQMTFPAWETYYKQLGIPVPEGIPGTNPAGLTLWPKVTLVYAFGKPDGWQSSPAPPCNL